MKIINPVCPKCGYGLTIKLNMVQKLEDEIIRLKKEIADIKGMDSLSRIFGGFKK